MEITCPICREVLPSIGRQTVKKGDKVECGLCRHVWAYGEDPIFETEERFIGCPPICKYENLPVFDDPKQLADWKEKHAPGGSIHHKWQCHVCKKWHYQAIPNPPAGSSSGTGRHFEPSEPRYKKEGKRALA